MKTFMTAAFLLFATSASATTFESGNLRGGNNTETVDSSGVDDAYCMEKHNSDSSCSIENYSGEDPLCECDAGPDDVGFGDGCGGVACESTSDSDDIIDDAYCMETHNSGFHGPCSIENYSGEDPLCECDGAGFGDVCGWWHVHLLQLKLTTQMWIPQLGCVFKIVTGTPNKDPKPLEILPAWNRVSAMPHQAIGHLTNAKAKNIAVNLGALPLAPDDNGMSEFALRPISPESTEVM